MDKDFAPKDGTDAVKDPAGGGKWEQLVSPHQGDVAKTEAEREAQAIEEAKAAATEELASRLHDVWREQYKREHGTTPRNKQTNDAEWIEKHGTNIVDLTRTDFGGLPVDWRQENEAAAGVVADLLHKHDVLDIEVQDEEGNYHEIVLDMARVVHDEWRGRENNSWAKGGELDVPFDELPDPEKEKDIAQVLEGIKLAKNDHDIAWGVDADEVVQLYNKYGQDAGFVPYDEG